MPNKYLINTTKIVAIYCFFFVAIKILAVLMGKSLIPNLASSLPFLIIGIITSYLIFIEKYLWWLTILFVILILVFRIFEFDILMYLEKNYSN